MPGAARTFLVVAGMLLLAAGTAPAALAFVMPPEAPPTHAGHDLYLPVSINDVSRDLIVVTHVDDQGGMSISAADLASLGLLSAPAALGADGRVELSRLPTVTFVVDLAQQTLSFKAPDTARVRLIVAAGGANPATPLADGAPPPDGKPGMAGGLLNYDIYASAIRPDGAGVVVAPLAGSFEARAFGPFGLIDQTFSALSDPLLVRRLDSTWSYSDPGTLRTYRVGDIVTNALSWSRPTRLGGIQIQNDFGLRSDIITYPVPDLSGSAALPSTVDIYVNNVGRYSGTIPDGPFDIVDLPLITGPGTVRMVVRDANGREVVTSADYLASQRLLRPGLSDYSAEMGFARTHFATDKDGYDSRLMASGSIRTGVNDWLTFEGHAEGGLELLNIGAGAVFAVGQLGIGQFSAAGSRTPESTGLQLTGTLQLAFGEVTLAARAQRSFGRFEDIASVTLPDVIDRTLPTPHAVYQLSVSAPVPLAGSRMNFSYTQVEPVVGETSQILAAGYSHKLFGGSLSASAYTDLRSKNYGLTASLWMPLGGDFSTGASVHNGPSGTSETADFSHADNNQVGSLGWLVRVNHDDETSWTASARSKLPMATVRARLAHAGGVTAGSAELAGAVVVADGGVFLTRPINDAFAIVDVGTPAIPVMFQNRALGVTGRDGKLVLPGLNAYEKNRISIDPSKLPLDSVVQTTTAIVVPADRAGVVVKFGDNASGGTALVTFRDAEGAVLPVGTTGKTVPGVPDFMVGYDGQALVQGLAAANALTLTLPDGGLCTADVPYAANGGAMVLIPGAVCRPQ